MLYFVALCEHCPVLEFPIDHICLRFLTVIPSLMIIMPVSTKFSKWCVQFSPLRFMLTLPCSISIGHYATDNTPYVAFAFSKGTCIERRQCEVIGRCTTPQDKLGLSGYISCLDLHLLFPLLRIWSFPVLYWLTEEPGGLIRSVSPALPHTVGVWSRRQARQVTEPVGSCILQGYNLPCLPYKPSQGVYHELRAYTSLFVDLFPFGGEKGVLQNRRK